MATAFVDVMAVNKLDSSCSNSSGQASNPVGKLDGELAMPAACHRAASSHVLTPSGSITADTPSILVQYTPDPSTIQQRPPLLLLPELKKAGKHKSEVKVTQKQGYFCHIEASILLELPPSTVYEIMTHPHNHDIFRAQKECTYRKVLSDDGVVMTVEVEHSAAWNFLFLSGTFHTRLNVEQSQALGKVSFHLLKSAVLHKFDGEWTMVGVLENEQDAEPSHTLLRLRQDMLPTIIPPPPADRLFRRLLGKQIEVMFNEIKGEVEDIKKGTPKLTYPPDQHEHINAEPRPLTAALSRPRSRADLVAAGGQAAGSLSRPRSLIDLVTQDGANLGGMTRPRSRMDLTTADGGKPGAMIRPRSRMDLVSAHSAGLIAAPVPSSMPRRPSLHAHMISLDQQDLAELGLELDMDMEDDEENVVFYDCLDEAESFSMLVERAGSTGLHFEDSASWLQRQVSLDEEDAVFLDAVEDLCGEQHA